MSTGQAWFLGLFRFFAASLATVGLFNEDIPTILFAILLWMMANTVEANWVVISITKKLSWSLGESRGNQVPEPPQRGFWDG